MAVASFLKGHIHGFSYFYFFVLFYGEKYMGFLKRNNLCFTNSVVDVDREKKSALNLQNFPLSGEKLSHFQRECFNQPLLVSEKET